MFLSGHSAFPRCDRRLDGSALAWHDNALGKVDGLPIERVFHVFWVSNVQS